MKNYYYLSISLPELEWGLKPSIRFQDLVDLFSINLSEEDQKLFKSIRLYFDLINLERSIQEEPLDRRSAMSFLDIQEALKFQEHYPDYVFEFFEKYPEKKDQIDHFPFIYAQFFSNFKSAIPDLNQMVLFEQEFRLFILGFRTIKFQRNWSKEFQYEQLHDEVIQLILSQKYQGSIIDERKLHQLIDQLTLIYDPLSIRDAVESFRFDYYGKIRDHHPFDLVGLLAYLFQLVILEDLDFKQPELGIETLNAILKEKNEHDNE